MALTKPPVLPAWAEAGDKVQPSNAEIQAGWPLSNVPPSRQRFNWLLNFLANGIRYLTRRGLPDWGADETYEIGDRVQGPDGLTYKSLTKNTNKTPAANPSDWARWGFTAAELGTELNKLDSKASCRVATTANLAALSGLLTIDGVVLVAGDRVLVKNQTTPSQNGIYVVAAGAWTRATDADGGTKLTSGATVPVEAGTTQEDTLWMLTTDGAITVGVTALAFAAVNGNVGTPGTYNQVTVDAKGRVVAGVLGSTGGKLLRITRYTTAGSGTWTKQADTNFILVRAVAGGGGGGGGGGAASGSNQAGNGGYSGRYGEKLITTPAASYSYTVGAAGSGGAVGSAGSAGGDTSFGAMTLNGGPGGQIGLGGLVALPTGSGWDFTCAAAGAAGHADSTSNVHAAPGAGGASPFAGGGSGAGTTTIPGSYGSGGGGGPRTNGTAYAGSNGGAGYIEVWEFA